MRVSDLVDAQIVQVVRLCCLPVPLHTIPPPPLLPGPVHIKTPVLKVLPPLPPGPIPPAPTDGAPELRTLLCIGGVDMKQQADVIRNSGIHMVVATPGRLKDMLT